jgi:hypothetical protein
MFHKLVLLVQLNSITLRLTGEGRFLALILVKPVVGLIHSLFFQVMSVWLSQLALPSLLSTEMPIEQ